ncbi:MAG: hypothetical protein HFF90_08830 [Oscillibacter sp.]|nr:hypothetical protein [Oscillibacter sp.]
MKLEKRASGSPSQEPPEDKSPAGKKPVVIYILILFLAAFILMILSLLMHQRSNTEALGQLNDSISAMKDAQASAERIIELQEELEETKELLETFEDAAETARNQASLAEHNLERTQEAMDWFWQLNYYYLLENTEMCAAILDTMNQNQESPMKDYLSGKAVERYEEICAALAEAEY